MDDDDESSSSFRDLDAPTSPSHDRLPGAPYSERWIAGTALALGVVADLLAFRVAPGLGLTITMLLTLVAAVALAGRHGLHLASRSRVVFLGAAAVICCVFSLRTSDDLLVVNAWT